MLDHLFSSWKIANLEIKNRLVVSPMVSNCCTTDGKATDKYAAYLEERAKGGWGLIITEDYIVAPNGRGFPNAAGLWEDSQMEGHRGMVERVHKHDTKIFAQLLHAGRQTDELHTGAQPVSPSPIPCPTMNTLPHELTTEEVYEIIPRFGDAARRCKECGFDGVQIHAGHGYLVSQFISSYSNKRTDEFGGSLVRRMRFPVCIIRDIREKCGEDFPIDIKISGEEMVPGGLAIADMQAAAMLFEQAGVSSFTVSVGVYECWHVQSPSPVRSHAWRLNDAAAIKSVVSVPVITVGRINDPFIAEGILRSGKADAVAMARQSLADPYLPKKAMAGDFEDIIHCTSCLQGCDKAINKLQPIKCMLNPLTARERELAIAPAKEKKKVFIAGGGPGGMEAAIVAAQRGHDVTLYERSGRLGGLLYTATIPPWKGELSAFISWQVQKMKRLGVKVYTNTALTPEIVDACKPDAVLVATGSNPVVPPIPGVESKRVLHADAVLEERAAVGKNVAVIGGGLIGSETANYLVHHNHTVSIIEMLPEIAAQEPNAMRIFLLAKLEEKKVAIHTGSTVEKLNADGSIAVRSNGSGQVLGPFDSIVLAVGLTPENSLADALKGKAPVVTLVGNAKAPGDGEDAIEDGYIAGLSV